MYRYYFDENNTGGRTIALGVLSDRHPHWCYVDADSVDEAIHKFEKAFDLDWNDENSYEGGSCNCCGRRFSVSGPKGHTNSDYDTYGQVREHEENEIPYFALPDTSGYSWSKAQWGCELQEAAKFRKDNPERC